MSEHFKHSTPKKSLRRKPPPAESDPATSSAPPLPPRLMIPPLEEPRDPALVQHDLTEQQILNISTPKPMGPRELPDYDFGIMDTSIPHHNENAITQDRTPPYPIRDPMDDFFDQQQNQQDFTNQRSPFNPGKKAEILDQSLRTPSKIPSLGMSNSLNANNYGYSYASPSEPINTPGIERHQRSPSPKKVYGRSPSLMYDKYQSDDFNEPEFLDNEDENDEEQDDEAPQGEPYLLNNYDGTSDVFDDELDSDPEYPTSKLFDYSILPDLPSATTVSDPNDPNSPTKKMTLNSAISFVKGPGYFESPFYSDDQIGSKPSLRKKYDELPPVPLDLPRLPFASSSLVSRHFSECANVWSITEIFNWCLKLKVWLHELFILKKEFKKALIKLLVFHRRDIPLDSIGYNVDQIMATLLKANALSFDYGTMPNEDGDKALPEPGKKLDANRATKANPGIQLHENVKVSGVLVDLTDCYCYDKHHHETELKAKDTKLRCLSSRCYLNRVIDYEIKFRQTNINEIVLGEDWATHWKLTAEDLKSFDKDLSKKQSLLFDLLRYEQTFIQRASCFVELVGPEFIRAVRMLIGTSDIVLINKFEDDVINPGKELLEIHQKSLFEPLLRILISNGKFIKDVSDIGNIYLNWSQVVKPSLLKYMGTVPMFEELINLPVIKKWIDVNVRKFERVQQLRVNGPLLFLSTFNSRYQQLPLQLSDIMRQYDELDSEYGSLQKAVDGIKKTSSKVNEMKLHADNIHALKRIQRQIHWKSNISPPNINFNSENRKFFYRGYLTRKGDLKINSSVNHVILLDNYLLVCERIKTSKTVFSQYKVIERPIPVEFLLVEIKERETPTIELNNITKTLTQLPLQSSPKHELLVDQEDPSIYPFKIRYAGHGKSNAYTFSTKSERERSLWVEHLMRARSNLCSRLSRVEPYKLKLISNTCFAYEESNMISKLQSITQHDPIETISTDALRVLTDHLGYKGGDVYSLANTSSHIVYSTTQCATEFVYNTTSFYFIATLSGVYCSDMAREWKRVVLVSGTSAVSVLPSINLVIMLHGSTLTYYPLDVLINYYYGKRDSISGVALTNDPVSIFKIGKHREITMIFYATKKGNSSGATNFKVCVPELDNDGIFSSFRVVKKFYVQADCYGLSIFNSTFAVHTSKGIEVLELEKLLPRSIPELPYSDTKKVDGYNRKVPAGPNANEIEVIRRSIMGAKPMGMFKLNNNSEFLLAYNECAIFVNKHGKLSRFTMLRYDYRAKSLLFVNNHLFIVGEEAFEVWAISDFVKGTNRLIQVLVGKDIRLLCGEERVICSIANPVVPGLQLLFQLYNNRSV